MTAADDITRLKERLARLEAEARLFAVYVETARRELVEAERAHRHPEAAEREFEQREKEDAFP